MRSNKFLIGYSGHSYPIIEALNSNGSQFIGYFEKVENEANPYNLVFLGDENEYLFSDSDFIFIAVGDNFIRQDISKKLKSKVKLFSILDSHAIVRSPLNEIGIIVNAGAIVQPKCKIGEGVIINSRATVEHECKIGNYVHIAPGAVLAGNVVVGDCTLIGANATILPGVKIGENCIIGAGSVVVNDVHDNSIVKGNPAR
jgi:sugar O-acyltransferase (sialic acid O-acetyltransferase NeuD family)